MLEKIQGLTVWQGMGAAFCVAVCICALGLLYFYVHRFRWFKKFSRASRPPFDFMI